MKTPLFISFYTPEYAEEVARFEESAAAHDVDTEVQQKLSLGRWVDNCAMKGSFIKDMLERQPVDRGVVWVDIDAEFINKPTMFETMNPKVDFAAFMIPGVFVGRAITKRPWPKEMGDAAMASGTLYFNNTWAAHKLLAQWQLECINEPNRWDQQSLQAAYGKLHADIIMKELPQGYCKIYDEKWYGKDQHEVIRHLMASRRLRSMVRRKTVRT